MISMIDMIGLGMHSAADSTFWFVNHTEVTGRNGKKEDERQQQFKNGC